MRLGDRPYGGHDLTLGDPVHRVNVAEALSGGHRQALPQALNILDRFYTVAKLHKALDEVRAGAARRIVREGLEPLLKTKRWCLLKRQENLADNHSSRSRAAQ